MKGAAVFLSSHRFFFSFCFVDDDNNRGVGFIVFEDLVMYSVRRAFERPIYTRSLCLIRQYRYL